MVTTINISLPAQLKKRADMLVKSGHYASFSDLTRTAIRDLLEAVRYEKLIQETKNELHTGKTKALQSQKDIDEYFNTL